MQNANLGDGTGRLTREQALIAATFDPSIPQQVLPYDGARWFPASDEVLAYVIRQAEQSEEAEDWRWDTRLDVVALREWPVLDAEPYVPEPVEDVPVPERPDDPEPTPEPDWSDPLPEPRTVRTVTEDDIPW